MAELPLAAGLMDLRNCKLSPKPAPPLPLPALRRMHTSATATTAPSPRHAVPELHSTTELADGSIVFRFGHPKSKALEPEPASVKTSPYSRVAPASGAVPGSQMEPEIDSEHGLDGVRIGTTAGVEKPSPNAAAEAWPTPPPPDAGAVTGATSAALEEAPEQEAGSNAAVEEVDTRPSSAESLVPSRSEDGPKGDGVAVEAGMPTSGAAMDTIETALEGRGASEDDSAVDVSGGLRRRLPVWRTPKPHRKAPLHRISTPTLKRSPAAPAATSRELSSAFPYHHRNKLATRRIGKMTLQR